ncbi:hypothetical protein CONPUDRAFT_81558 [Coniophora puteana RWD-64-598 SS2]|uniref:Uncharacterized protein n=1 Tax=Coniophora puteana (strain RWD-64-598) TaxID=741705 RepID=A0A5M3MTB2_CONPW|nr:uncharacterized protein CONPUDRAFT_81558 [Coniophora puteana RWD-64-598 SS2]EIW81895.1 hypothetical protein CONPUDRAFT_81558 [Coniophora puteana RWD-64-598 SS2]
MRIVNLGRFHVGHVQTGCQHSVLDRRKQDRGGRERSVIAQRDTVRSYYHRRRVSSVVTLLPDVEKESHKVRAKEDRSGCDALRMRCDIDKVDAVGWREPSVSYLARKSIPDDFRRQRCKPQRKVLALPSTHAEMRAKGRVREQGIIGVGNLPYQNDSKVGRIGGDGHRERLPHVIGYPKCANPIHLPPPTSNPSLPHTMPIAEERLVRGP